MESKRIKLVRQSKARPRTLRASPYYKTGQSVDRTKIPKEFQGICDYRNRAKGLLDPYLEALFPGSTMSEEKRQAYLDTIPSERDRIIVTSLVSTRLRIVLKKANTRFDCIEFVEYLKTPNLIRFSITYNNDDRAMDRFAGGSIHWKTVIELGVEQSSV